MKKLNLLILSSIIYFSSMAQQVPLSSIASITLPKNAEKIDKKTMVARSKKLYRNSELKTTVNDKNLYKVDDLSLGLWDVNLSDDDNNRSLEKTKSQALELFKLDKNIIVNEATIKTINANQFLLINYSKGDTNFIRFLSKASKHKSLNGVLEFGKPDKQKAALIMNSLLENITFK